MNLEIQQMLDDVHKYSHMVGDIVRSIANSLTYLDSFRPGEARVELAKSIDIDTKADRYRRGLIEGRLTAIKDSIARGYILSLLRMLDRVAEWAKESMRYLDLIPYMEIPSSIKLSIQEMVAASVKGIERIAEALNSIKKGDYASATAMCREVEHLEEKVDELLHKARKNLIVYGSRIQDRITMVFLKDFIESIESITDYEEDAADIIRALAMYLGH
ncbi:MAG: DUF47 family protein [Ignisphaera sp.]|nr:DUF47 family protein [Ignisphaera sp.]MCX8167677.1 DUF47 family protein [Ignisphaera sp.]MDW8085667.1 DUF47 family protein [Ignisphaera sp.]